MGQRGECVVIPQNLQSVFRSNPLFAHTVGPAVAEIFLKCLIHRRSIAFFCKHSCKVGAGDYRIRIPCLQILESNGEAGFLEPAQHFQIAPGADLQK